MNNPKVVAESKHWKIVSFKDDEVSDEVKYLYKYLLQDLEVEENVGSLFLIDGFVLAPREEGDMMSKEEEVGMTTVTVTYNNGDVEYFDIPTVAKIEENNSFLVCEGHFLLNKHQVRSVSLEDLDGD